MRKSFLVLGILVAGCSGQPAHQEETPPPSSISTSQSQTWTGIAEDRMAGPFLEGASVYVDFPDNRWPTSAEGKRVSVTGIAVERHDLPVFIPKSGEPEKQGIPEPAGTDLYKASARTVIEHTQWSLVGNGS